MTQFRARTQKRWRGIGTAVAVALLCPASGWAQLKELRPGFNLFSPAQDVEVGKEAAAEVERRAVVVHNGELDEYLNVLLRKLEQSRYARSLDADGRRSEIFPFTIRAIYDKNINAFSLPGGPIFINTAVIPAAENEAQLAGVIAHEMSHVVLRHSTNQASKRNIIALPAVLLGALAGDSTLGRLAQIGISFGANSALLKFSRTDEADADYNGAEILADAGYNPLEMARFFEILEAKGGRQGGLVQFLSDHPNPGNRAEAVNDEIRRMPRRKYVEDETGRFDHVQAVVRHLSAPTARRENTGDDSPSAIAPPTERPSERMRSYEGRSYSLEFPDNWQIQSASRENVVTLGPRGGVVESGGRVLVGYGLEVGVAGTEGRRAELERDTRDLIDKLRESNADMRIGREARRIEVDREAAILSTLYSDSPYRGEQEVDVLVTVARPEGLFYMVFIAPRSQFDAVQGTFEDVVRSVRFR